MTVASISASAASTAEGEGAVWQAESGWACTVEIRGEGSALEWGLGLELHSMFLLLTERAHAAFMTVCLLWFRVGLMQGPLLPAL